MRIGVFLISAFIVLLTILGFIAPFLTHHLIDANYLLTVIATAGALGGIAFAIYGWYSSRELPKMIDQKVNAQLESALARFNERLIKQQEAMQKVIASYQVSDTDRKIDLLQQAIDLDPTVYNALVSLGYVYWYDKDDFLAAEQCFQQDMEYHPDNYQAASDLAALYAHYNQLLSSLSWIRRTLELNPAAWKSVDEDTRFDAVRQKHFDDYEKLIKRAKSVRHGYDGLWGGK
ncbi:tetratricopeptide repeat protein [Alicyclobacillus mengziensis]|uniref:Tetratricopeptide repeat protein n=1 Tax=Alicyclobacillus mengziensis TaxID=2931921 RepID=A0A9X7VZ68_9BACL|nr:hypothetical protein [Alicyclobacillus mengziensis]QSO47515.1 hypothetical protein JZ786_00115 [Alicyclobacillus mengziensis]